MKDYKHLGFLAVAPTFDIPNNNLQKSVYQGSYLINKNKKTEEQIEYEYHVQSQLESIARFKNRHPNGAKIDVNATFD